MNSQNFLKDELVKAFVATCEKCGKIFKVEKDLKDHMNNEHDKSATRISFQTKLRKLEIDLSKQRMHLHAVFFYKNQYFSSQPQSDS